jgi:hypothetical protein
LGPQLYSQVMTTYTENPIIQKEKWLDAAFQNEIEKINRTQTRYQTRRAILSAAAALYQIQAAGLTDNYRVEMAIKSVGKNHGFTEGELNKILEWGKRKGSARPRVISFSDKDDRTDFARKISEWIDTVQSDKEIAKGRRRLLLALGHKSSEIGKLNFSLSQRQMAELAGVTPSAIKSAFQDERFTKYIKTLATPTKTSGKARVIGLRLPSGFSSPQAISNKTPEQNNSNLGSLMSAQAPLGEKVPLGPSWTPEFGSSEMLDPANNVWYRKAVAWAVYSLMTDGESRNISETARIINASRPATRKAFGYLLELGLVTKPGNDYRITDKVLTSEDEQAHGIRDMRTERAERHQRDREGFKAWAGDLKSAKETSERRAEHREEVAKLKGEKSCT